MVWLYFIYYISCNYGVLVITRYKCQQDESLMSWMTVIHWNYLTY